MIEIEPLDIEVFTDKKIILHDIVDYDNNISDKVLTKEEKLSIVKFNEEISNIIRENKLTFSTDTGMINNKLKDET